MILSSTTEARQHSSLIIFSFYSARVNEAADDESKEKLTKIMLVDIRASDKENLKSRW